MHRYVHEALEVLAAKTPSLPQALTAAAAKAYVILDGTVLRIDRVAITSRRRQVRARLLLRQAQAHGVNVQTIADPAGRLIWASPALPGSVHDLRAAREHGILTAPNEAGVQVLADRGYQGAGRDCPSVRVPQRSRCKDPATGKFRPVSAGQRVVNRAHAGLRAPGERANAQLKNWRALFKVRSSPHQASTLVAAIQTLILAG